MDDEGRQGGEGPPAAGAGGRRLRLVGSGTEPGAAQGPPPPLRLLREFKGPTVAGVLRHVHENPNRLPGRLLTVSRAIEAGDLAAADRILTEALATILPGPGYRRRPSLAALLWPIVVLGLGGAILATLIAGGVLGG